MLSLEGSVKSSSLPSNCQLLKTDTIHTPVVFPVTLSCLEMKLRSLIVTVLLSVLYEQTHSACLWECSTHTLLVVVGEMPLHINAFWLDLQTNGINWRGLICGLQVLTGRDICTISCVNSKAVCTFVTATCVCVTFEDGGRTNLAADAVSKKLANSLYTFSFSVCINIKAYTCVQVLLCATYTVNVFVLNSKLVP